MAKNKGHVKKWIDKKEKEEALKVEREEEESPDEDIYDKEDRQDQLDDDEISPAEAGFVEGYLDVKEGECNTCGKQIDPEKVVEKEVSGQILTFCSQHCADIFEKRKARD